MGILRQLTVAQTQAGWPAGGACLELNRLTSGEASAGDEEVASALSIYLSVADHSAEEDICAAVVFSFRAAFMGISGRVTEAENTAVRSVAILDQKVSPENRLLIRPLHTLADIYLILGKTTKAWNAYRRMLLIPAERPEDRALVHDIAGALHHHSGRLKESEKEYLEVLRAMDDAGFGGSANTGSALTVLASVYIEDKQFDEARMTLERATTILDSSPGAMPTDRIGLLQVRGVLHARQRQWQEAERYLSEAVAMVEREKLVDPRAVGTLWTDYAAVLRKTHRSGEAKAIESRAAAFQGQSESGSVIDVHELSSSAKPKKK